MVKRWALKILKTLWYIGACSVILAAVMLSIARAITPSLGGYRTQLEAMVSKVIQQPITIANVKASWNWFDPVLQLSDVVLLDESSAHSILKVKHLDVSIDLLSSLWNMQITPGTLNVSGASIIVRENIDGKFTIDGVNSLQGEGDHHPQYFIKWLFNQDKIYLHNVDLRWITSDQTIVPLTKLSLLLVNDGEEHHLRGYAKLDQTVPSKIYFVSSFTGEADDIENWQGGLYVDAKDVLLGKWLQEKSFVGLLPMGGIFRFRLWMDWHGRKIHTLQTRFAAKHLNVKVKDTDSSQLIQELSGNFSYDSNAKGWNIKGDQITLRIGGNTWPENKFFLNMKHDDNGLNDYKLYFHYLDAGDVLPLVAPNKYLLDNVRQAISELNPHGELYDVLIYKDADKSDSNLQLDFHNLSFSDWRELPKMQGLSGSLQLAPEHGALSLDSTNGMISYKKLFPKSQVFSVLHGQITWNMDEDKFVLTGNNLSLINNDMSFNTDFVWHKRKDDSSKLGELSMIGGITVANTKNIPNLIPTQVLSINLVTWLKNAFIGGGPGEANFALRGNLDDFPFKNNKGIFLADVDLNNSDINYWHGWIPAKKLLTRMSFRNSSLNTELFSGTFGGMPIKRFSANIPDIKSVDEILDIDASFDTTAPQVINFLSKSPLKKDMPILDKLDLSGLVDLDLKLTLPFKNTSNNFVLGGAAILHDAVLNLSDIKMVVEQINGALNLSKKGLTASGLKAKLFSEPVVIGLKQIKSGKKDAATSITVDGAINIKSLSEKFKLPLHKFLHGKTKYHAILELPKQPNQKTKISINTDLQGVSSNLIKPLAKKSKESLPLEVNVSFFSARLLKVKIKLAEKLSVAMLLSNNKKGWHLQKANFHLGSGETHMPRQSEILLDGKLDNFNSEIWMPYLKKLSQLESDSDLPLKIDLKFKNLNLFNYNFTKLHLNAKQYNSAWVLHFIGPEIKGDVMVPENLEQGISVKLDKLIMTKLSGNQKKPSIKPSAVPPLLISIGNFIYDDMNLGSLVLETANLKNEMLIKKLKLTTKSFDLNATGKWFAKRKITLSKMRGNLVSNNLASSLQNFGITPIVNANKTLVDFDLSWLGAPYSYSSEQLNGTIFLKLSSGNITHLSPETERKIGLGKLINILSLQSLPQRLMLNFGDLSKKGFTFSKVQSHMHISNGNAKLSTTFVDGTVAYLALDGSINLAAKTYKVLLKITPYVTSSLPVIVATVAGSPIAGAATFVATKIFGHVMRQKPLYIYKITGPWDEPIMKEIEDSGIHHKGHHTGVRR